MENRQKKSGGAGIAPPDFVWECPFLPFRGLGDFNFLTF